jgi:hypothetical protein
MFLSDRLQRNGVQDKSHGQEKNCTYLSDTIGTLFKSNQVAGNSFQYFRHGLLKLVHFMLVQVCIDASAFVEDKSTYSTRLYVVHIGFGRIRRYSQLFRTV